MAKTSFMGDWWDPNAPSRTFGGVLTLHESGKAVLKVIGQFSDDWNHHEVPETIFGAAEGKQVTLFHCQPTNGTRYFMFGPSPSIDAIHASVTLFNAHVPSPATEAFSRLEVEIAYLTLWTGMSGVEQTHFFQRDESGDPDGIGPLDRISVTAKPESAVGCEWNADTDTDIELVPTLTVSTASDHVWSNGPSFQESIKLRVSSGSERAWDGFNETAGGICDLMTLATQQPSVIRNRVLYVEDPENPKRPRQVELYMHSGYRDPKPLKPHDVLFRRTDLDFDQAISDWCVLRDEIGLAIHILFGLDYASNGYLQNQVFNAAAAAEGIHAGLFPDAVGIDVDVHRRIKRSAVDACTKEDKSWIKRRLSDNRPDLRDRLHALCALPSQEAVDYLLTDRDIWAGWLTRSRNAIGHADTEGAEKAVPEDALYRLPDISKALLHLVLMERIGVSQEKQISAARDGWGYLASAFHELVEQFKSTEIG